MEKPGAKNTKIQSNDLASRLQHRLANPINVGRKPKLSPEQQVQLAEDYLSGKPVCQLVRDYKVCRDVVYKTLKRLSMGES